MKPRKGFSIFEAVVSAAILAILGAAILPAVASYRSQARVNQTATDLLQIGAAVQKFELTAFVGAYPGALSDLTTEFALTSSTSCVSPNRTYTAEGATLAKWRLGGPYLDKLIPQTGLLLGVGVANNTLERSSANTSVGFLNLRIPGVAYEDALALNDVMDGQSDLETAGQLNLKGAIRWFVAPDASDNVSLLFAMPIGNRC
ncbi:MAG: prepilin-type N-terminal cleavage/methylation domain-containing protein [Gemmatimonadaceae bacterium]|nr:prepilin-type N-terminal cleavage/methylation domain-containing protein [Gemmatimonadaceae bacterium]